MRSTHIGLGIGFFLIACSAAQAEACKAVVPSEAVTSDVKTAIKFTSKINVPARWLWSQPTGTLSEKHVIKGNSTVSLSGSKGQVFYVEATLDGERKCPATLKITSPKTCRVTLVQDADFFYVDTAGGCEKI